MATITVRNIPEEILGNLKRTAERNGRSMEQEIRELLHERFMTRAEVIARIRARWSAIPPVSTQEADSWRNEGRP